MNGNNVAFLVTTLATVISEKYSEDEVAILASLFTQLGDTLTTISTINQSNINKICEDK